MKIRNALKDPLVWGNLILRLAILAMVLTTGRWLGGDSNEYLASISRVLGGEWGGISHRPPLYQWYFALLVPGLTSPPTAAQLVLPLLIQTLLVWAAGVFFRAFAGRLIAFFWLFDPPLLVYSTLIMTDAQFSVLVLILGIAILHFSRAPSRGGAVVAGIALGAVLLGRPIGMPIAIYTIASFVVLALRGSLAKRKENLIQIALLLLCTLAVIAPRVGWDRAKFGYWGLSSQGDYWIYGIAGAVQYHGQGLSFIEAEKRWYEDHPVLLKSDAWRTVWQNAPVWAWLSAKGTARVLFGHVNVEWGNALTGKTWMGPGWFKQRDRDYGPRVEGAGLIVWTAGIFITLALCLFVYVQILRAAWRAWRRGWRPDAFAIWCLISIVWLVAAPQLLGDARFRIAAWPLILILWREIELVDRTS